MHTQLSGLDSGSETIPALLFGYIIVSISKFIFWNLDPGGV